MLNMIVVWVASAVGLVATASLLSGFQIRNGFKGALLVAAVLGLLNAIFGKVLFHVIGIGTLGLGYLLGPVTRWLVMTLMLIVTDKLSDTLTIRSIGTAVIGAIGVTFISEVVQRLLFALL